MHFITQVAAKGCWFDTRSTDVRVFLSERLIQFCEEFLVLNIQVLKEHVRDFHRGK